MIKHRSFQCWGVGRHVNLSDVYQQRGNVVNFWNFNMTGLRHQKLKDVTSELSQFSPFISRLMDIQNPTPIGIKRCPNVSDHSVVLVVQSLSCIQRCDPVDCGPPGSSVHGIFQARMLEWDAISFSGGFSWTRDWYMSPVLAGRFFTTKPPGKLTHVSVCVCVCDSVMSDSLWLHGL